VSHTSQNPSPLKPLLSCWLPVILWAAVIFILSNNPDPYGYIPRGIYHWLWWTKLFGQSLFFYLGGLAHILEYAILSFLLARALFWRGDFTRGQVLTVFYLILFYAYTDEFHQLYVPGRAFQMIDLLLDALGATIGLGAYIFHLKRAEVNQSRLMQGIRNAFLQLKNRMRIPA